MNGFYFATTNRFVAWLACRGLLLIALLLPAAAVMAQLSDRHWLFSVGQWGLLGVSVILLVFHIGGHGIEPTCPRATKTADVLKKRRHRLVLAYARLWPLVVGVFVLCFIATPVLMPYRGDQPNDAISLGATARTTGVTWIGLSLLAAYLFKARHAEFLPPREDSARSRRFAQRLRLICHRSHWAVVGAIATMVCAVVFVPEHGPWSTITSFAVFLVLAAFIADGRHSSTLCEPCVAEFRVDAPEYAAGKSWLFSVEHKGRRFYRIAVLVAVAVQLSFSGTPVSITTTIAVNALLVAQTFVNRFHRMYNPWCPYCHPGNGGHEEAQVPDPTGGHGRPVPA
ncbi:hypothetical protein ACF1A9_20390 [Streptomyces sp. NPDC014872]|uniref:hypothetical protein n=1 Tax=Streptomyces sp. NPDC014872 TaxID=3364926 RepID=UPI0037026C36